MTEEITPPIQSFSPLSPSLAVEILHQPLDPATFLDLADQSGWHRMTQNALAEKERLPFVLEPKPVVITIKDSAEKTMGAIGGINYGAYAFMQYMMIPKSYQKTGLGTLLIEAFQDELVRLNGGETSIALLAHPESLQYYLNRGFVSLTNGLVLKRGRKISPSQN